MVEWEREKEKRKEIKTQTLINKQWKVQKTEEWCNGNDVKTRYNLKERVKLKN